MPLQFWIGSTDINAMLMNVGGWHVGSCAAREADEAVQYAIDRKWVQERTHHFPDGDVAQAYELTDAGLDRLEQSCGPTSRDGASKARQWYRDRAGDY